jgi:1-acyl-sn-glycerol-3-phosphate acyltransferase
MERRPADLQVARAVMQAEDVMRRLREDQRYETDTSASSCLMSVCPTATVHLGIWYAVVRGYLAARRGAFDSLEFAKSSYRVVRPIEKCGGRLKVQGLNHVARTEGSVVFVANHMSLLEAMILPLLILAFKEVAFVVKKSLLDYPLFGRILRSLPLISVTRQNPREDFKEVLNQGTEVIGRGISVVVFPQSTRSAIFNPESFNTLGIKLAHRARVPVLPVALKTDFLDNGRIIKDLGRAHPERTIYVEFGAPLGIEGTGRTQHEQTVAFISDRLRDWGAVVPS